MQLQAKDGKYYVNPVLVSIAGTITCDENDVMISVRKKGDVEKIVTQLGCKLKLLEPLRAGNGDLKWWGYISVESPVPVPVRFESVSEQPNTMLETVGFWVSVKSQDLKGYHCGHSELIDWALVGIPAAKRKSELLRQFPWLKFETLNTEVRLTLKRPKRVRVWK